VPAGQRPCDASGIVDQLRRGTFHHLNRSAELGYDRTDWRLGPIAADRLWTVTLHYHAWADVLAEVAAAGGPDASEAATLLGHYVGDWITRCPVEAPGARHLAWNAYAVATRITWWVRAGRAYPPLHTDAFLRSLWEQAAYLRDHLEYDLRANHLLRDAVGLVWAGRFFGGDRAAEWLQTGTKLAVEQVAEQVLPDGGHFERSTMYHLHVMEDVLTLAVLAEDPAARKIFRDTWQRMAEYAAWCRHPDGQIPLFNDAALNGASTPNHLLALGESIGVPVDSNPRAGGRYCPDTGLAVWHGGPWSVFFDVGPLGPDYQPGHGHADTLIIECSYRGRRLFVDPGTYAYDDDSTRGYDRYTAAHNTVTLDGRDSSEVWHVFRVGRRAKPTDVAVEFVGHGMTATAGHTGYDHLPGRLRHVRRVVVEPAGITITDTVGGRGTHTVEGGYLLSPEWSAQPAGEGWTVRTGTNAVRVTIHGPAGLRLSTEPRPYHPEFGKEEATTRLMWRYDGPLPVVVTTRLEPA
jgi:uncharacterized heparinase superfamily protein